MRISSTLLLLTLVTFSTALPPPGPQPRDPAPHPLPRAPTLRRPASSNLTKRALTPAQEKTLAALELEREALLVRADELRRDAQEVASRQGAVGRSASAVARQIGFLASKAKGAGEVTTSVGKP